MAHFSVRSLLLIAAVLLVCQADLAREKSCVVQGSLHHSAEQLEAMPDTPVLIQIALSTPNSEGHAQSLLDISSPDSPNYGRHWTAHQVAEAFAPDSKHVRAVASWLNSSGLRTSSLKASHGRGHMHLATTVREAGRLLETSFRYAMNGQLSCDSFQLPEDVASAVDYVVAVSLKDTSPMSSRSHRMSKRRNQRLDKKATSVTVVNCTEYTTPSCLRDMYKIPSGNTPHHNNSFGIYEISWETWLPDDLDMFFTRFQPDLVGQRPVVMPINGGYLQTDIQISPFNIEADFDFEYAMSLMSPQPVINIQVGDRYQQGTLNNMLAAFDAYYCGALDPTFDATAFPDTRPGGYNHSVDCGTVSPPKVISISYGYPEASFPPEYLRRQCLEFLKLGLMGVTVVTGSGDQGVASPGTSPCLGPGSGGNATAQRFSPVWPASCPWVTSVGGTQHADLGASEAAFNTALGNATDSSGGGFSNVFGAPAYQRAAAAGYLRAERAHLGPLAGAELFSASGRGVPDVAALASAYLAVVDGALHTVYGTSASAPVFASMIALINGERLSAGRRGTVGFVNPVLYAHPEMMNDVVIGSNTGCGVNEAFRAVEGWDAVTGLGSPDYERMRDVFLRLP